MTHLEHAALVTAIVILLYIVWHLVGEMRLRYGRHLARSYWSTIPHKALRDNHNPLKLPNSLKSHLPQVRVGFHQELTKLIRAHNHGA